jgi:hypothetical protein
MLFQDPRSWLSRTTSRCILHIVVGSVDVDDFERDNVACGYMDATLYRTIRAFPDDFKLAIELGVRVMREEWLSEKTALLERGLMTSSSDPVTLPTRYYFP